MARRTIIIAGWTVALAARLAWGQAVLPTAYTGPWRDAVPPSGWVLSGLGSPDYADFDGNNDGAAKLDDAGDSISIHYDLPAESVSFWIQGFTFISGGVFRVQQSVDGTNWMEMAAYSPPPAVATFQTLDLSSHARHVRFVYSERVTGNVGLDGVSIAKSAFFVITRFERSGEGGRVWVVPTAEGRLYELQHTTNVLLSNAWVPASSSYGNGGELELIDPLVHYPRCYRVLDVTAETKRRRSR
ncbi:MAG: hypothetical protein AB7V14_02535 [Kiritimatiellia bacterium]